MQKINEIEVKRFARNIILFIAVYAIMGGVKSIVGDAFRSYIRLSNKTVSQELSMFIGFAMIILVIMLVLAKKIGHKTVLIIISISMIVAFIASAYFTNYYVIAASAIVVHLGDKAFDLMMALIIMAYTNKDNRIITFTKAIILNVIVSAVVSMLDGKIVVYKFKQLLGISYDKANAMTSNVGSFNSYEISKYMQSYRFVIWIAVAFTVVALILLLMMREKKEDYMGEENLLENIKQKEKFDFSIFKDKYVIAWIVYSTAMGVESNFITPNLTIYFNRILHISRGATSTIMSAQSLGMLVFLLATPYMVKKMGNIKSFALLIFLSGPVMIMMGMGNLFVPFTAVVMGVSIFLRYGFTHAVHPVQDSIQLLVVKKENRPIFVAIIAGLNAIISIIIGFMGAKTLFSTAHGYHMMFYGFAIVFMLCGILVYVVYNKKFDKSLED